MPWRQGMRVCSWFKTEYVLAALCILNSLRTIQCGHCPSGWQEGPIEDHCFAFMSNSTSWNKSEIACQRRGGHLAALGTLEELEFVDRLCAYNNVTGGCWVGGSQQKSSGGNPNWTDCQVLWNISAFPRAPTPSSNCFDVTCPYYLAEGWCTVVINRTLKWESCVSQQASVCGLILGESCGELQHHREYFIIIVVVSTIIVTTTLGVTIWLLAYRTKKRRRTHRRLQASLASPVPVLWRVFEYAELEAFTGNFAEANKLSNGEDKKTHKGILPDGSLVVIKQVMWPNFLSEKDFIAEMRRIGRLKHRNLVSLKGCCFNHGQGYIVYEFISNGTLEKWLHRMPWGAKPLDWDTRMRIATGVADILAFIHDKMQPNLVHRNLRASSILLDDEFNPHVLVLGLVNMSRITRNENEQTVIAGTHGYFAPEFIYRNELTTKGDVFSFGILLLELITGRAPAGSLKAEASTSDAPSEPRSILEWATPLVQAEAWTDLLDVLIGTVPNYSQVKKVVDLVYICTQHVPSMRPRMSYVFYELRELHTAELMTFPMGTRNIIERRGTDWNGIELASQHNMDNLDDNTSSDLEIREVHA